TGAGRRGDPRGAPPAARRRPVAPRDPPLVQESTAVAGGGTATAWTRVGPPASTGQGSAQARPRGARAVRAGGRPERSANQNVARGVNATSAVTDSRAPDSSRLKRRSAR